MQFPRYPRSLKFKLMALATGAFVAFIWATLHFAGISLEAQAERVLADQQSSVVRHVAMLIEQKVDERLQGLVQMATALSAAGGPSQGELQKQLGQRPALASQFPAGIEVIDLQGQPITDRVAPPDQATGPLGKHDYFRQVVERRQPYIDKLMLEHPVLRQALPIAVPVFDPAGNLTAVLAGITDLTTANFLGPANGKTLVGEGDLLVLSPRDGMVLLATDPKRSLTALPPPGNDEVLDRFLAGFEGTWHGSQPQGVARLYTGKWIPGTGWLVVATQPTEAALRPVRTVRAYLYGTAAAVTLAAIVLLCWLARRVLAPLEGASRYLDEMGAGRRPLQDLPPRGVPEIARVLENFNRLHRQMRQTNDFSERLIEQARMPIIGLDSDGRVFMFNHAATQLSGYTKEEIIGTVGFPFFATDSGTPSSFDACFFTSVGTLRETSETQLTTKSGGQRLISWHHNQVERPDGFRGVLSVGVDLTARRRMEEQREEHARHVAELSRRLVAVQEEERRRLASVVHDLISPNLAAAKLNLGAIEDCFPPPVPQDLEGRLADTHALLDDALASARDLTADLRPAILDYAGLYPAVDGYAHRFAERTGIAVEVSGFAAAQRLPPDVESVLFRIVQEALSNCARHSQATRVNVVLRHDASHVTLTITDDGIGFAPENLAQPAGAPGLGLLTMRERAEFAGGKFRVETGAGVGTRITVEI